LFLVGAKVLIISFANPHAFAELGCVQIKAVPLLDFISEVYVM